MGEKRRAADRAGRPAMRSPGRPPVGRLEHRQRFWAAIARGLSSEDAAVQAGVSVAVGVRWFREGGGMPTVTLAAPKVPENLHTIKRAHLRVHVRTADARLGIILCQILGHPLCQCRYQHALVLLSPNTNLV